MKNTVTPICLIAPTEEMMRSAKRILKNQKKDVDVFMAGIGDAAEVARELAARGARFFVSRRGVHNEIRMVFPGQTVEIRHLLSDYIPLLQDALFRKGLTAFFVNSELPPDVRTVCSLMKISYKVYYFHDLIECEMAVRLAVEDGAVFGIGGADSARFARALSLPHTIIENSEESVLTAVSTAEQLLRLKHKEQEEQRRLALLLERYQMVFNYTHDGIISVDEAGRIVMLNKTAQELTGHDQDAVAGTLLSDILPGTRIQSVLGKGKIELHQLLHAGRTAVSVNQVPIMLDDKVAGAIITLQDIKALQKQEIRIRMKLHERGLTAKYHFQDIIGNAGSIRRNIHTAEIFAASDATIMIFGETGTGKELFAQSIHNASRRKDGPFVAINCGAIPQNLLEAELFGYEEGSFTGAVKGGKKGLFETAHGGTVFLDEIGEMPPETQVHLLRVLQEKEIRRIGSDRVIPIDIRIIAATHRDLKQQIRDGAFREDLFFRLNILELDIPPLRERKEDIPLIAESIYRGLPGQVKEEHLAFLRSVLERFSSYDWPGNVRELYNLTERIQVLLSQDEDPEFVYRYIASFFPEASPADQAAPDTLEDASLDQWEKDRILKALKENRLEINSTAKALGISRATLWRKMKKYEIG